MKTSHIIIIAGAAAGAYWLWRTTGRGAELATVRNDANGPRLPSLPSLPPLPSLSSGTGAAPNMPKMPKMPKMPSMGYPT
jgi:hypothetical protein